MGKNDFSVLIASCDKNINLLEKFLSYFKKNWPSLPSKIYISLEKNTALEGRVRSEINGHIFYDPDVSWSKRVKNCLQKIDGTAVLLLLDDFIIESAVLTGELDKINRAIIDDSKIAAFALTPVPMENASDKLFYDYYYLRSRTGRYKTTLQCGMWRRETLIKLLNDTENAWEFELFGNFRSYLLNEDFYAIADDKFKPIDYNNGLFCVQGKLNLPELKRLEEKLGGDFRIKGMEDNKGIIVRDDITFLKRVIRRIKIILIKTIYLIRYRSMKNKG